MRLSCALASWYNAARRRCIIGWNMRAADECEIGRVSCKSMLREALMAFSSGKTTLFQLMTSARDTPRGRRSEYRISRCRHATGRWTAMYNLVTRACHHRSGYGTRHAMGAVAG